MRSTASSSERPRPIRSPSVAVLGCSKKSLAYVPRRRWQTCRVGSVTMVVTSGKGVVMRIQLLLTLVFSFFVAASPLAGAARAAEEKPAPTQADEELTRDIGRLVQQLNDDRAAERDAAETKLLELAGTTTSATDKFLELLPEDNDQMPLAVRERLSRIRQQAEDRVAKVAVEATILTLSAKEMPLAEVFAAIEKQTGNRMIDNRQQEGDAPDAAANGTTIELKDEPFWPAFDQILDQSNLGIYSYGGEDALSIVSRQRRTAAPRPRHLRWAVPH